jgi:endonuclease III
MLWRRWHDHEGLFVGREQIGDLGIHRFLSRPGFRLCPTHDCPFLTHDGPTGFASHPPGGTVPIVPRESAATRHRRAQEILQGLRRTYPDAHCELNFSNPLELLVATILSAQCTDKQVNIVTASLFQKYRTAADYAAAEPDTLAQDIRRIGLFRAKAKNLQRCGQQLVEHHQGSVPQTMDALTSLAGVGRKTANVVLGNAFGIEAGVVVDTHVARLASRLGLSSNTAPEKIEQDLMKLFPQDQWTLLSHWLIWHGRRRCAARNPDCAGCEIRSLCPSAGRA